MRPGKGVVSLNVYTLDRRGRRRAIRFSIHFGAAISSISWRKLNCTPCTSLSAKRNAPMSFFNLKNKHVLLIVCVLDTASPFFLCTMGHTVCGHLLLSLNIVKHRVLNSSFDDFLERQGRLDRNLRGGFEGCLKLKILLQQRILIALLGVRLARQLPLLGLQVAFCSRWTGISIMRTPATAEYFA